MTSVDTLHKKWLKRRPGYAKAVEGLKTEYEVAQRIVDARAQAGLTQAALAKRMKTTRTVIARLESGNSLPSTSNPGTRREGDRPATHDRVRSTMMPRGGVQVMSQQPAARNAVGSACDPVTLEIVRGAIRAAQAEMEALIERTAISAFIREKKDFYTALFDADGVMAVGSNLPVFGDICGPVFRDFPPDTMREGDLYWYNDCYGSRGAISHSNDQVLLAPVFHDGRRCGFVMGWAHFSDIGGMRAGSISPDTLDIFQEGIIVPPTKLIDAGTTNEATLRIFFRNSRFPEQNMGDMRALMASAALGVKRIEEIVARFGSRRGGRCARPARGPHPQAGAHQARRDLRLRHPPLHRRDRFGRPRQRPVPPAAGADAREDRGRRGQVHLRRHRDRRPVARAGQPAAQSRRAGHGAVDVLSRRRPGAGLQRRRPAGARRGPAARRLAAVAQVAGAARHARPHPDALPRGGERADQRRGRQGAGGALGLRHLLHARHLQDARRQARAVPDVRRHRRRLGRARHGRRHRRGLFRGAGELPGRVPRGRLSGAAADLRHPHRFLRRRAAGAAAAASCASTTSSPRRRCWPCASTA